MFFKMDNQDKIKINVDIYEDYIYPNDCNFAMF